MSFSSEFINEILDARFHTNWEDSHQSFLDKPICYLASFPRSGNGWVRQVVATAALNLAGESIDSLKVQHRMRRPGILNAYLETKEHQICIEDVIPGIYNLDVESKTNARDVVPDLSNKLIKTHHVVDCSKSRAVFLFRDPNCCLVSAALFFNGTKIHEDPRLINDTIMYLSTFYQGMLSHFVEQYRRYPANMIFVNHQHLLQKGTIEFQRLLEFMGVPTASSHLDRILNRLTFKSKYENHFEPYLDPATNRVIQTIVENEYSAALKLCSTELLV